MMVLFMMAYSNLYDALLGQVPWFFQSKKNLFLLIFSYVVVTFFKNFNVIFTFAAMLFRLLQK